MSPRPLYFFFDFLSPYAHLAWFRLQSMCVNHPSVQLTPTPVVFAAFLNKYGHKGPAEVPPKRVYLIKDVARIAHAHREQLLHIIPPISPPPTHPFNPLLALRVATALLSPSQQGSTGKTETGKTETGTETATKDQKRKLLAWQAINQLFVSVWGGGAGVETPEAVKKVLGELGLDGDSVIASATTQENKDRLKANTELAIAKGAFGVPTMVVDNEIFWGFDSLPHLEAHLAGKLPDFSQLEQKWQQVKPSVSRT